MTMGGYAPRGHNLRFFVGASLLANSFRQQAGSYENQFFVISVRPKFMTTRLEALRVSKPLRMNLSVFRVRCNKLVRKRSIRFIGAIRSIICVRDLLAFSLPDL